MTRRPAVVDYETLAGVVAATVAGISAGILARSWVVGAALVAIFAPAVWAATRSGRALPMVVTLIAATLIGLAVIYLG